MRPKVLSIDHTAYTLDYDKNGKAGVQEWRKYIHSELEKLLTPDEMMLLEAKKILTQKARYIPTHEENIKGDRIIYALMFAAAIGLAIMYSI